MIFGCGELQEQPVFLWYFWRWGGWGSLLLKEVGTQKLPLLPTLWLLAGLCCTPGCEVSQERWRWHPPGTWWPCPSALCPSSVLSVFSGFQPGQAAQRGCLGVQDRLSRTWITCDQRESVLGGVLCSWPAPSPRVRSGQQEQDMELSDNKSSHSFSTIGILSC